MIVKKMSSTRPLLSALSVLQCLTVTATYILVPRARYSVYVGTRCVPVTSV